MLIDQSVPAPIGGVTSLPPQLRGRAQVTEAINTFPSLVDGLGVRRGTLNVTRGIAVTNPSQSHSLKWSPVSGMRFLVTVGSSGVLVTDIITGVTYIPTLRQHYDEPAQPDDGTGLLGTLDFAQSNFDTYSPFFFGTPAAPNRYTSAIIGDSVYVAVRGYSRATWHGQVSPAAQTEAVITSLRSVVGGTLTVNFNELNVSMAVGGSTEELPAAVMETLFLSLLTSGGDALNTAYTFTLAGNSLKVTRKDASITTPINLTISVQGGAVNEGNATLVHSTVATAEQLPEVCMEGFIVKVAGILKTTADDYWVIYNEGRWKETAAPSMELGINNYIMPWVLKMTMVNGQPSFQFGPVQWETRNAGDDTSNPLPALLPIETLFSVEQRLGFTSGATIVLSQTGNPLQIFRTTVAQLLPSDPINVESAIGPNASYHAAPEWDNNLYLWSGIAQTLVSGDPVLTPTTISTKSESSFENDPNVSPLVIGSRIYYVRHVDECTRVYEYWRPPGYNMPPSVNEITETCPTYLRGQPVSLVGDEALGFLAVKTSVGAGTFYVCHFSRDGNGQIQPRWHTWRLDNTIIHAMHMIGGKLYLLLSRNGSLNVESLDVANPAYMTSTVPADAGGNEVHPEVLVEGYYPVDDKGVDMQGRFTIRNLTLDYNRTLKASVVNTEGVELMNVPVQRAPISGQERIPLMCSNIGLKMTYRWQGFLTGFHMQGTLISRNIRR